MKRIAIQQSGYIPWKGFFDMAASVDELYFLDTVQYTRSDWRNRNIVKDQRGNPHWLSIPILTKGRYNQTIVEAVIADLAWQRKHWERLRHFYRRSPHFDEMRAWLEPLYTSFDTPMLSQVNQRLIREICTFLDISTVLRQAPTDVRTGKSERLLDICLRAGATCYVCGPATRAYLDETLFAREGIRIECIDFSGYRPYPQPGAFMHTVSVLDLLFRTGTRAPQYLLSACATAR